MVSYKLLLHLYATVSCSIYFNKKTTTVCITYVRFEQLSQNFSSMRYYLILINLAYMKHELNKLFFIAVVFPIS